MNIYKNLNELIEYIEENLEENIDYNELAKIIGTNEYTMRRIFSLLTDVPISEYIRNRRLSNAVFDLYNSNEKIVDIAVKYQYDNATSFSRAFEKFHGIKPSNIKKHPEKLKIYTKLKFNENINENSSIEYSIISLDEIKLWGKGIKTTYSTIKQDAPNFWIKMNKKYEKKYGLGDYGLTFYEARFDSPNFEYWIAYEKEIKEFKKIVIPKSKWISFKLDSQEPIDIHKLTREFYEKFIPSSKFKIRPLPELEYYTDNMTELLFPIED